MASDIGVIGILPPSPNYLDFTNTKSIQASESLATA
jgi:hypothetical protein